MNGVFITWTELLIAVVLATAVYLLEFLFFSRRRKSAEPQGPGSLPLGQELASLREEVSGLRRRLDAVEELGKRASAPPPGPEDSPYSQAVRLARQGLPAQELAARCGISRGEAELIIALNRGDESIP
jgi:Protein of unknown function (DUF2802)